MKKRIFSILILLMCIVPVFGVKAEKYYLKSDIKSLKCYYDIKDRIKFEDVIKWSEWGWGTSDDSSNNPDSIPNTYNYYSISISDITSGSYSNNGLYKNDGTVVPNYYLNFVLINDNGIGGTTLSKAQNYNRCPDFGIIDPTTDAAKPTVYLIYEGETGFAPVSESKIKDLGIRVVKDSGMSLNRAKSYGCLGINNTDCHVYSEFLEVKPTDVDIKKPGYSEFEEEESGNYVGTGFCFNGNVLRSIRIVGYLIAVLKLFVPLIIVGFSIIEFYKSTINVDKDTVPKQARKVLIRVIIGMVIFFVPSLVHGFLQAFYNSGIGSNIQKCESCLLKPFECEVGEFSADNKDNSNNDEDIDCSSLALDSCSSTSTCTWNGSSCVKK